MNYYISLALAALRSDTIKDACTNQENRTKDMHNKQGTNRRRLSLRVQDLTLVTVICVYTVT